MPRFFSHSLPLTKVDLNVASFFEKEVKIAKAAKHFQGNYKTRQVDHLVSYFNLENSNSSWKLII